MTQQDVDRKIDRLIALALKAEAKRDTSEYEFPVYWKWHDVAIAYHTRAEKLMPK